MTVQEFEDAVWRVEGIRVVVRAHRSAQVGDYKYTRGAQETWRVPQLIENRIQPKVGKREIVVMQGDGEQPHGRVILRTVRASYKRRAT